VLEMRQMCERCSAGLNESGAAVICSFECTFCADCGEAMEHRCPNCGGELVARPRRGSVTTRDIRPVQSATAPDRNTLVRQCQSCGMPLVTSKAGDCRGTEADGTRSQMWCSLCFVDGTFLDPDCTVSEMQDIVDAALKRDGRWIVMRWLARRQIPTLARWR